MIDDGSKPGAPAGSTEPTEPTDVEDTGVHKRRASMHVRIPQDRVERPSTAPRPIDGGARTSIVAPSPPVDELPPVVLDDVSESEAAPAVLSSTPAPVGVNAAATNAALTASPLPVIEAPSSSGLLPPPPSGTDAEPVSATSLPSRSVPFEPSAPIGSPSSVTFAEPVASVAESAPVQQVRRTLRPVGEGEAPSSLVPPSPRSVPPPPPLASPSISALDEQVVVPLPPSAPALASLDDDFDVPPADSAKTASDAPAAGTPSDQPSIEAPAVARSEPATETPSIVEHAADAKATEATAARSESRADETPAETPRITTEGSSEPRSVVAVPPDGLTVSEGPSSASTPVETAAATPAEGDIDVPVEVEHDEAIELAADDAAEVVVDDEAASSAPTSPETNSLEVAAPDVPKGDETAVSTPSPVVEAPAPTPVAAAAPASAPTNLAETKPNVAPVSDDEVSAEEILDENEISVAIDEEVVARKRVATPPAAPVAPSAPPPPPPRVSQEPARAAPPPSPDVAAPKSTGAPPPPPVAARSAAPPEPPKKRKAWFEQIFNDDYLRVMPRYTRKQVAAEGDFIEQSLGVEKGATILDVGCGTGRHAIELALRGYEVVALDLSLPMLSRAADEAQDRGAKLNFLHADMREIDFVDAFDAIYCVSTSFGFFEDERNTDVIQRMHRALKPGGTLLLETLNRDYAIQGQPAMVWYEGDGCVCMEETSFNFITSRLTVKRTLLLDDGRQRESEANMRLYALHELGQMLHQTGFRVVEVSGHFRTPGAYFGPSSRQLIILAQKKAVPPPPTATTQRDGTPVPSSPPAKETSNATEARPSEAPRGDGDKGTEG